MGMGISRSLTALRTARTDRDEVNSGVEHAPNGAIRGLGSMRGSPAILILSQGI